MVQNIWRGIIQRGDPSCSVGGPSSGVGVLASALSQPGGSSMVGWFLRVWVRGAGGEQGRRKAQVQRRETEKGKGVRGEPE